MGSFFMASKVSLMAVFCISLIQGQNSVSVEDRLNALERRVADLERIIANGSTNSTSATVQKQTTKNKQKTPVAQSPVHCTLITKKLHKNGGDQLLGFLIQIANHSNRAISTLEGDVVVRDMITKEEILRFSASIEKYIASHDSTTWYGGPAYDSDDMKQRKVLSLEKSQISIDLDLASIAYADGSKQRFKE